ncbi:mitochondrial inner membrane protease subunit 1 [Halyomorpha halys]|uniref:mitochondrial inner membrane protease subunit 1 n=1 Tax=Halyomorpha halys TaxID=286706 RepID=UPI0006D52691|nr:mitochondrial inner membrane protease subunit 1 [Halyomorpha halys]
MENLKQSIVFFGKIIKIAVQWGCIGHCTFEYVGDLVLCTGRSMEPTLHHNDIVISDHCFRKFRGIRYGDVVVAKSVSDPKLLVCKRVMAQEGDVVLYYNRYVLVPTGHVWLLGDNRDNSSDSRDYGPVPVALIRGRVVCRIWPFGTCRMFQ